MQKTPRTLLIATTLILMIAGMGCMAVSKFLTPTRMDKKAVAYVVETGIAEPNDYIGYANLEKSDRLKEDVEAAYKVRLFELQQKIEFEDLQHSLYQDVVVRDNTKGHEREKLLFAENGLLSTGMTLLGFGGFTGLLGLMRKRPGDVTQGDYEQAVATIKNKTVVELTEKEKQLVQLVKGVRDFMKTYEARSPEVVEEMKVFLNKAQDENTRIAVARAKAKLA